MDMYNPFLLAAPENSQATEKTAGVTERRFTRIEMHIAWLRHDVNDIKSELLDIRSEIKDVRSEIKEVRGEIQSVHKDMRADFRLMFSALIGVALGLTGIMARGFHWL